MDPEAEGTARGAASSANEDIAPTFANIVFPNWFFVCRNGFIDWDGSLDSVLSIGMGPWIAFYRLEWVLGWRGRQGVIC